jgi:para-nitrobenzyl esterase
MGALGFLSLPGMDSYGTGAFGFLDQQLALKWTYDNAALFGGDPNKIAIFGESAGGSSVTYHLMARSSWPYFSRAIIQSGAPFGESRPLVENLKGGLSFAEKNGCGGNATADLLACMRALPSASFIIPLTSTPTALVVNPDGPLTQSVVSAVQNSAFSPVPVFGGNVANEGSVFAYQKAAPMSPQDYQSFVSIVMDQASLPAEVAA